jgi:hypothetical protein
MHEYQQLIIDALIDKKCEVLMNCISKRNTLQSNSPDCMAEFIAVNARIDAAMAWVQAQPFCETLLGE